MPKINNFCVEGRRGHDVKIVSRDEDKKMLVVEEKDGLQYMEPFDHVDE